jgi:hypothetical protein
VTCRAHANASDSLKLALHNNQNPSTYSGQQCQLLMQMSQCTWIGWTLLGNLKDWLGQAQTNRLQSGAPKSVI